MTDKWRCRLFTVCRMMRRGVFGDMAIGRSARVGVLTESQPVLKVRELDLPPPPSLDLYRRFSKLPGNGVTREIVILLGDNLAMVHGLGARRQQGLIYWYKAMIGLEGVVSPAVRSLWL